jgi:hypothetical protein
VAGTQTGNPVVVTLKNKADTTIAGLLKRQQGHAGQFAGQVAVTGAWMVVAQVKLESSLDEDSLDFESGIPYIMNLNLTGQEQSMDTLRAPAGGTFDKVAFQIDRLEAKYGNMYAQNPDLQDKSILILGYLNQNPADTFSFSSAVNGEQVREFSPPLALQSPDTLKVVLVLQWPAWFSDTNGVFLNPQDPANRSRIEERIKASIRAEAGKDD